MPAIFSNTLRIHGPVLLKFTISVFSPFKLCRCICQNSLKKSLLSSALQKSLDILLLERWEQFSPLCVMSNLTQFIQQESKIQLVQLDAYQLPAHESFGKDMTTNGILRLTKQSRDRTILLNRSFDR